MSSTFVAGPEAVNCAAALSPTKSISGAIERANATHIGRGLSSDVRIEEQRVSRSHAILVRHGQTTRLLDNRSANGTFVNGRRIVATNIADGDVIRIGPVVMTYLQVT